MTEAVGPDPRTVDAGAYVLGALDPAERAAFERHLRHCTGCSQTVSELAGLPPLLAAVPVDVAESLLAEADQLPTAAGRPSETEPPGLLDGVIARATAEKAAQRSRRVLAVAAAAAVAVLLSVAGVLATTGGQDGGSPATGEAQILTMEPVDDVPVAVTARLASVAWGTRIELECHYEGAGSVYATPPTYALVVRDESGDAEQVATWQGVAGRDITVQAATAVPRDRIATLEVQTADGRPVLTADR